MIRCRHPDVSYTELLRRVMEEGDLKHNRTGVDTLSLFGQTLTFDLRDGFPILTTKRVNFRAVAVELLWFISGVTSIKPLIAQNVHIWDEWPFKQYLQSIGLWEEMKGKQDSDEWKTAKNKFCRMILEDPSFESRFGILGPGYGHQWRHGGGHDQLAEAIELLKSDPNSRRIIVNSWNVSDIPEMIPSGLPPCHYVFQFYVANGMLSCDVKMRSADLFLGVPFNIASYALLTHLVGKVTGLTPAYLKLDMCDAHIYMNHLKQVKTQLERSPRDLPRIEIAKRASIDDYVLSDINLIGYEPHEPLPGRVAI